ncbi:MAG: hypothetical protein P1V51_06100 [Deltaproteobacteria bacterium]|nr:hypothetical protein [Deltaproteobacteria bacterium]
MKSEIVVLAMLLAGTLVGCGKSETGEACTAAEDCKDTQCIVGGSFPEGLCTPACDASTDCPEGFVCISRSSGICLATCTSEASCTESRGTDWQCREESLEEGGGVAMVCIGA